MASGQYEVLVDDVSPDSTPFIVNAVPMFPVELLFAPSSFLLLMPVSSAYIVAEPRGAVQPRRARSERPAVAVEEVIRWAGWLRVSPTAMLSDDGEVCDRAVCSVRRDGAVQPCS